MTHTQGPWTWTRTKAPATWNIWGDDGIRLAEVVSGPAQFNRAGFVDEDEPTQGQANARLIAAAPDLLLVAKCALAMVSEGAGPPDWDWIREVIAKAQGKGE